MTIFSCKTLTCKPTAVSVLKQTRINLGLSVKTTAKQLSISPEFIEYLEETKYNRLPGEIYIKNIIKKYAVLLHLDAKEIIAQYELERQEGFKKNQHKPFVPICQIKSSAMLLRRLVIAGLGLFLIIYLGMEVGGIFQAPPLELESPTEGQVVLESALTIKGTTNPEMKVQINGIDVISDNLGLFSEMIVLNPGNNQIIISAIKKHGRSQTLVRNVIYREKKEDLSLNN